MKRRVAAAMLLGFAFLNIATPITASAPLNRAAIVIDTGAQLKNVCVAFPEESISAVELLKRSNVPAVFYGYAGEGAAVCSLNGKGCPADSSCLTCGGANYWAYSRAPAGTNSFRYWGHGASNTQVRNGDVDGWRWGTGTPPSFVSFDRICNGNTASNSSTATQAPPRSPVARTESGVLGSTESRAPLANVPRTANPGVPRNDIVGGGATTTTAVANDAPPGRQKTDQAALDVTDNARAGKPSSKEPNYFRLASTIAFIIALAALLGLAMRARLAGVNARDAT